MNNNVGTSAESSASGSSASGSSASGSSTAGNSSSNGIQSQTQADTRKEIEDMIVKLERGIQNGDYDIKKKNVGADKRKLTATFWEFIYEIHRRDESENVIPCYVYCVTCKKVIHNAYKNGNTNKLTRHLCTKIAKSVISTDDKAKLKMSISAFVAQDIKPYRIVDGTGFKGMCRDIFKLGQKYPSTGEEEFLNCLPCRNSVKNGVHELSEQVRKLIVEKIELAKISKSISIAIDNWTEDYMKVSYFGVVAIIAYATADGKIHVKKFTLSVNEMTEIIKTKQVIAAHLYEVLESFGLTKEEVKAIVTIISDRGSNVKYGIQDENITQLYCYAHIINNIVGKMLTETNVKNCVNVASELATWNSAYFMFQSIIDNYANIVDILDEKQKAFRLARIRRNPGEKSPSDYVENIDINEIVAYAKFLKPFKTLTDSIEGHLNPTIHKVWAVHMFLEKYLYDQIVMIDTEYNDSLTEMIYLGRSYMEVNKRDFSLRKEHKIAAVLNPLAKKLPKVSEHERLDAHMLVDEELIKILPPELEIPQRTVNSADRIQNEFDFMIDFYDDTTAVTDTTAGLRNGFYSKEFQSYLDEEVDKENFELVDWWETVGYRKFPNLFILFIKYGFIPATSSVVEAEFSLTGMTVSSKRSRIKPKNVNDLMVARNNCV